MDSNVFRGLSYGVYLITAPDGERPTGCVANSLMQVTSSPATVALSLNHNNYTNGCIARGGLFGVTILAETSDPSLIGRFGFASGKDTDKFHCYAKTEADDEWVELDEAVKQDDTFIYDLSGGHYCYFRFETRSKGEGGQELKANSFAIDYYTEAPEIY